MPHQVQVGGAHGYDARARQGLLPALPPSDRAREAALSLLLLLPRLEVAIVPDPRRAPPSSSRATPSDPRRAPWSPPVAEALFHLASAAWHACDILSPQQQSSAISSWHQAPRYLSRIPALLPSSSPPQHHQAARVLETSLTRSLQAIGDEEPWRPVYRDKGAPPPRCPHSCHLPSLRMRPHEGKVICVSPHCRDSAGYPRPSARLYPARTGDGTWHWQLVWRDGTIGLGAHQEKEEGRNDD